MAVVYLIAQTGMFVLGTSLPVVESLVLYTTVVVVSDMSMIRCSLEECIFTDPSNGLFARNRQ